MPDDDRLTAALERLTQLERSATKGPWRTVWDSCDCGDGYGCSHGSWPHAIRTGRPNVDRGPGSEPRDHDYEHSGVADLGSADVEFIVAARREVPRLLHIVNAVRALCMDADGGWLPGQSELPVGEFQAALALIDDGLTDCPEPHDTDDRCYDCATDDELSGTENADA